MKRTGFLLATVFLILLQALVAPLQAQPRSRPQHPWRQFQNIRVTRDIVYAEIDGIQLKLDAYEPKTRGDHHLPMIVFIHGGGWRRGDKMGGARFMPALINSGYVGFSINYRLTDVARFPAQIEDCKAAIRWIRKNSADFNGDPNRIGVFGTSAGGHLSALVGTSGDVKELEGQVGVTGISSSVQAVCDWFGPTDFTVIGRSSQGKDALLGLFGRWPDEVMSLAKRASPITYVDNNDPPFLMIHGTEDSLVPVEQSRRFLRALKNAGVEAELVEVPGGGHGRFRDTSPDQQELVQKMLTFFTSHLNK